MSYLHLDAVNRTLIFSSEGQLIRTSKNLRGMRDYARVSAVARVCTRRDENLPGRGVLIVEYANGATCTAGFTCFEIMIDFVRNRRTWKNAKFHHADGNLGYLTRPAICHGRGESRESTGAPLM